MLYVLFGVWYIRRKEKLAMAIHFLVIAKLQLLAVGHSPRPPVGLLIWPFILKLPIQGQFCKFCNEFISSSTLFLFRLSQIVFQEPPAVNGRRWERAVRLVRERMDGLGRISAAQIASDEDSFLQASMIAL